jgi:hypothetical protein
MQAASAAEEAKSDLACDRALARLAESGSAPTSRSPIPVALKAIGGVALWLLLIACAGLLVSIFIHGGAWLSEKLYPWLAGLSFLALAFSVLALLPLAAFKETRGYSGTGFFIVSYVFGATLWVWSFLVTYALWGGFALIIGLFMAGIGVLPIALLASGVKGMWPLFGQLILVTVATFATRGFGIYLVNRAEESQHSDPDSPEDAIFPHKLVTSTWVLLAASFIPYIGFFTIVPFIVCAIILCCSRARKARRHGRALLAVLALMAIVLAVIGFMFSDFILSAT